MVSALLDFLRTKRPNAVPLTGLPESFHLAAMQTARDIIQGIQECVIEATPARPDGTLPDSVQGWLKAIQVAGKKPKGPSPRLQIARRRASRPASLVPSDTPVFPDEVESLGLDFKFLCHIERLVRDRLHESLSLLNEAYESDSGIIRETQLEEVAAKMDAERRALGENLSHRVIDYLDFGFVMELVDTNIKAFESSGMEITRGNWSEFKDKLVPLRNAVMHSRPLKRKHKVALEYLRNTVTQVFTQQDWK